MSTQKELDIEIPVCVGAVAAAVCSLLPYVSLFVLPSYFLGSLVGVRYFVSSRRESVPLKEGAKLGFYATLLGNGVAIIIFDVVWQAFDYQIGGRQNADLTVALLRSVLSPGTVGLVSDSLEQSLNQPFAWHMALFQIIGALIFAGAFGSLSGLLSAKLIRVRKT
jgi:hypothetical protein